MDTELSIGGLAARTGTSARLLRTWETRFGFPEGRRTPSGHRRFTEDHVAQVQEVVRAKDEGLPLQVAIDLVRRRSRPAGDSVHAALVHEHPDLPRHRWSRRTLVAASHAIEDECLARADRPLVLGAFQVGHRFAASRRRWQELARTAAWCAVAADFSDEGDPPGADPVHCQLAADSPMGREWTVVTLGPVTSAVLAAWEVPGPAGEPTRFESVISTERDVATTAARVLLSTAEQSGVTPPAAAVALAAPSPGRSGNGEADRLWARCLAELDPQPG